MNIELLEEPRLEFGNNFLCDDPKMGITVGGFYSTTNQSHKSEINYSIIGTKNHIELLNSWIGKIEKHIEAEKEVILSDNIEIDNGEVFSLFDDIEDADYKPEYIKEIVNKKFNPDFPGFNKESIFKSEFQNDATNNISIKESEFDLILASKDKKFIKQESIVHLYNEAYINLIENFIVKPDICFFIIPSKVFNKLGSIPFGNHYLNLRRMLKASILSMKNGEIPIQIILEDTLKGTKNNIQDLAMISWNFVIAQYYKTQNCIPWILNEVDKNTCFVGISFHRVLGHEKGIVRSSVAQAFNREGKGLVFMGKQFEWDTNKTKVSSPHLQYNYALDLLKNVLTEYKKILKHTPSRIVIHKTTDFWDSLHDPNYAEIEGINDGIKEALNSDVDIDLVTIKSSDIKLLRSKGNYPVPRGTLFNLSDKYGVLFVTGYIPYYETYPGVYVPHGLDVKIFQGESTVKTISKEILALTKLNFNNCNYYDGLPITLRFAKKVGEILQYLPEGSLPPNKYYFYM